MDRRWRRNHMMMKHWCHRPRLGDAAAAAAAARAARGEPALRSSQSLTECCTFFARQFAAARREDETAVSARGSLGAPTRRADQASGAPAPLGRACRSGGEVGREAGRHADAACQTVRHSVTLSVWRWMAMDGRRSADGKSFPWQRK
jgi:hypothetical protein